jgi:replicative DNA helicase
MQQQRNEQEVPFDKLLPWSRDIERSVLGALLRCDDEESVRVAVDDLQVDDFHLEAHKRIFLAIKKISDADGHVDCVTVSQALIDADQLESVDGVSYLVGLDDGLASIFGLEDYIQRLKSKANNRRRLMVLNQCQKKIQLYGDDPVTIEEVDRDLKDLERISVGEEKAFKSIEDVIEEAGGINGLFKTTKASVTTPFAILNHLLGGGFRGGDYVVLAAKTSYGKTSLALQIANHAMKNGVAPVVVSLEMSNQQLLERMACMEGGVDSNRVRHGIQTPEETRLLMAGLSRLMNAEQVKFDDRHLVSMTAIKNALRKHIIKNKVGLVIIDYLQLLEQHFSKRKENRQQEVSFDSRTIKLLAKELGVPFLVLSQLSRGDSSTNPNRKPRLSDLRESGSIEQDADVVMFLWTDQPDSTATVKPVKLILAKQRNGPKGFVNMVFHGPHLTFGVSDNQNPDCDDD